MTNENTKKKLITIFAWFLIPLAVAVIWYKFLPERFHPVNSTNNGDLLDPIFTLKPFTHKTVTGDVFSNVNIEKVWTLVHYIEGECDENCSKSLYNTRQLRISMGKDIDRLNRIALYQSNKEIAQNKKMWASHPDMAVLFVSDNGVRSQIKANVKTIQYGRDSIFLVDPLGNVMMHFSQGMEPKLIKKDIRKLLKLSHIG